VGSCNHTLGSEELDLNLRVDASLIAGANSHQQLSVTSVVRLRD
jgi:hypothetical protein